MFAFAFIFNNIHICNLPLLLVYIFSALAHKLTTKKRKTHSDNIKDKVYYHAKNLLLPFVLVFIRSNVSILSTERSKYSRMKHSLKCEIDKFEPCLLLHRGSFGRP